MTGLTDDVMQAAKRLRRIAAGDTDVYPAHLQRHYGHDVTTLVDFALSILPDGERPVAMERPSGKSVLKGQECPAWSIFNDQFGDGPVRRVGCCCDSCWPADMAMYPTESAARLALQWMRWDELVKAAEQ